MANVTRAAGTVVVFWAILFLLGPDHFTGIDPEETLYQRAENRLYFTLTTLSTVGYGDMSPKSASARIVTAGMMVLLILGAVA